MAKYLIHTYPKRLWYVSEYLIPSMLQQGICSDDIRVYNDIRYEGNLASCMKAFASCTDKGGTWHLQDDVCICNDFRERTEQFDDGIVCGFSSLKFDGDIEDNKGYVDCARMWFSFPCIRIPNDIAVECAEYVNTHIIGNDEYYDYWKDGANDDWAFRTFMKKCRGSATALNITPCLVNHIDYLIGGGSGKQQWRHPIVAQYWEDDTIIDDLKARLSNGG